MTTSQIIGPSSGDSESSVAAKQRSELERRSLGVCAVAAVAIIAWLSKGVGVGILLGALTAFVLDPLYMMLVRRLRRRWAAQSLCLLLVIVVFFGVLLGVSGVVVTQGSMLFRQLVDELQPGGHLRGSVELLGRKLTPLGIGLPQVLDKLRDAAGSIASLMAELAATVAGKAMNAMLTIFFLLLTARFVLVRGRALESAVEEMLPLAVADTRALFVELRHVGRATLLGTLVTGMAQGLLACGIFAVVSLPAPAFFGAAVAVASLIPGVGTLLVWIPAGGYLIATGHVTRGVVELVLSAVLVIGFCDYVLRPRLVASETMPVLLTFVGLFGGVEAFGLVGLLTGPLLMALGVAVLKLYRRDHLRSPSVDLA